MSAPTPIFECNRNLGGSGILGGLFGVGGREIFVPLLAYLFGFSQHQAQGTSLACCYATC